MPARSKLAAYRLVPDRGSASLTEVTSLSGSSRGPSPALTSHARLARGLRCWFVATTADAEDSMDWKKIAPWNWFKEEESVPVSHPHAQAGTGSDPLLNLRTEFERLLFPSRVPLLSRPTAFPGPPRPRIAISAGQKAYTVRAPIPGVELEAWHQQWRGLRQERSTSGLLELFSGRLAEQ